MSESLPDQVVVVGPDGQPVGLVPGPNDLLVPVGEESVEDDSSGALAEQIQQPAKVMRVGSMVKQLLEEVRTAPLDEASRVRLREIHQRSVAELEAGLSPDLVEELNRLTLPFTDDVVPTDAELRIAQAQLVGWLEGLFHGIQAAMVAQQMALRAEHEMRRRALPPGSGPEEDQRAGSSPYL